MKRKLGCKTSPSSPLRAMRNDLPLGLRVYLQWVLVFTALTVVGLLYRHIRYHNIEPLGLRSTPTDRFGDFWHYRFLFRHLHTREFFTSADRFAYPAACAVIYDAFYHAGPRPHLLFIVIFFTVFLIATLHFYRMLLRQQLEKPYAQVLTAVMLFTSYPWGKLYDRANLELFVFVFLASGLWAYLVGRRSLAAVLWGCAGGMKIYPLVMLGVFLQRKSLKFLALGVSTFVVVMVASFAFVGPTISIAFHGTIAGIFGFLGNYAASVRMREINIDHSLLAAIKELILVTSANGNNDYSRLSLIYQIVLCVCGPLLFVFRIRKLPILNQLCVLIVSIVLFPPVSYDYTLVHMYLVFGMVLASYLAANNEESPFPWTVPVFFSFALLTTSQGWAMVEKSNLRFNGVIKCAALVTLMIFLLTFPLRPASDSDAAPAAD